MAQVNVSILRLGVRTTRRWVQLWLEDLRWRLHGCPAPPPAHVKRAFLRKQARRYGLKVFIETGTWQGDTLAELRNSFDELHSIELSQTLHRKAAERFRDDTKIKLWQGDSGEVLADVLTSLCQPALFWLDGHVSGEGTARGTEETPIRRELLQISKHHLMLRHVVVIDDARLFDGSNGYPDLSSLRAEAVKMGFAANMDITYDMITLYASRKT